MCCAVGNLLACKQLGFSDRQIGRLTGHSESGVRAARIAQGVTPWVKQIDTLAAEFPAHTNYLYTTYHGSVLHCTAQAPRRTAAVYNSLTCALLVLCRAVSCSIEHDLSFDTKGVMVLGCGAYRIGK